MVSKQHKLKEALNRIITWAFILAGDGKLCAGYTVLRQAQKRVEEDTGPFREELLPLCDRAVEEYGKRYSAGLYGLSVE